MTISLETLTVDPSGSENGLVVRNLPSGKQLVEIDDGYGNILGTTQNPLIVNTGLINRVVKTYYCINQTVSYATEAMLTLTPTSDFIVGSNGTSFGVTANKILRIQAIYWTGGPITQANLRVNNSGSATVSSTQVIPINISGLSLIFHEGGLELSGNMQFGISMNQFNGPGASAATVYVIGYEY
jgi:hypothetical protein